MNSLRRIALLLTLVVAVAACGRGSERVGSQVTVFAAASLTEAFTRLGAEFETEHPEVEVLFNFAASSALITQIENGAPADVIATADETTMTRLVASGAVDGPPATFARNRLAVIVGPGNPHGITSVRDLADPDLIVVLGAPQVPVGRYSAQVLERAGIGVVPRSFEADVKAVVTKVTSGEADAGIAYATDVRAAGAGAVGIEIPDELNVVAAYPVAVTTSARNRATARDFVAFVNGPKGQAVLAEFGFGGP